MRCKVQVQSSAIYHVCHTRCHRYMNTQLKVQMTLHKRGSIEPDDEETIGDKAHGIKFPLVMNRWFNGTIQLLVCRGLM